MANRALLVGINKYRIPGADLNGCVNDVTNVRDVLLKHFAFTVKE
ncbi:MAG: caspase family protein, partial [Desulfobacteraceae bacterium]|nr:caspase family protein [Desulfobacteraceae bacterium]